MSGLLHSSFNACIKHTNEYNLLGKNSLTIGDVAMVVSGALICIFIIGKIDVNFS